MSFGAYEATLTLVGSLLILFSAVAAWTRGYDAAKREARLDAELAQAKAPRFCGKCRVCGYETMVSISGAALVPCPSCKNGRPARVIEAARKRLERAKRASNDLALLEATGEKK